MKSIEKTPKIFLNIKSKKWKIKKDSCGWVIEFLFVEKVETKRLKKIFTALKRENFCHIFEWTIRQTDLT
jgi:hypothetical protein